MSRDWRTTGLWGLFLVALFGLLLAWERSWLQLLLLGGAALLALVLALALRSAGGTARAAEAPETSYPVVMLAGGLALALLGVAFGPWLLLPGVGLALAGAGGALREVRR